MDRWVTRVGGELLFHISYLGENDECGKAQGKVASEERMETKK